MKIINNDMVVVNKSLALYEIVEMNDNLFLIFNHDNKNNCRIIAAYNSREEAKECMNDINKAIMRGDEVFTIPKYNWEIRVGEK